MAMELSCIGVLSNLLWVGHAHCNRRGIRKNRQDRQERGTREVEKRKVEVKDKCKGILVLNVYDSSPFKPFCTTRRDPTITSHIRFVHRNSPTNAMFCMRSTSRYTAKAIQLFPLKMIRLSGLVIFVTLIGIALEVYYRVDVHWRWEETSLCYRMRVNTRINRVCVSKCRVGQVSFVVKSTSMSSINRRWVE
jgi:hypothetical protein